ncbi:MAG: hypothetical protein QW478_11660 [Candidatus Micrarchaeaceae archaeon]
MKRNNVSGSRTNGDRTTYSLTVKNNYGWYAQKLNNKAKEDPGNKKKDGGTKVSNVHRKRLFSYRFSIMDIDTRTYTAFRSSVKSEREAYVRAINFLSLIGIEMDSIRLDRYCSSHHA